jgi:hypothetical protein
LISRGNRGASETSPKNLVSLFTPKFMQRLSFERTVGDDALRFGAIYDLARFSYVEVWRKFLSESGCEAPPLEIRSMKTGEKVRGLLRLIGVAANLQRSTLNPARNWRPSLFRRRYVCTGV